MFSKSNAHVQYSKPGNYEYANGNKTISLGSVVLPSTITPDHFEAVLQSPNALPVVYENLSFASNVKWLTLRELLVYRCLDISILNHPDSLVITKISQCFTPAPLLVYKKQENSFDKIPTRNYDQPQHIMYDPRGFKNNDHELFVAAKAVGHVLYMYKNKSEIETYQEISKILSEISYRNQDYILNALKFKKKGDIRRLAATVTNSNILYIMSKLKLSASLPLIYTFATSPSIMGKLVAIWQFLEIHELIYLQVPWGGIQSFIATLYRIGEWLFEKTRLMADLMQEGYEWVKAKVLKTDTDPEIPVSMSTLEKLCEEEPAHKQVRRMAMDETSFTEEPPKISFPCSVCGTPSFLHCSCGEKLCDLHTQTVYCCDAGTSHLATDKSCQCTARLDLSSDSESDSGSSEKSQEYCRRQLEQIAEFVTENTPEPTPTLQAQQEKEKKEESIFDFVNMLKIDEFGKSVADWLEEFFKKAVNWFDVNPIFTGILSLAAAVITALGFTLPQFSADYEIKGFFNKIQNGLKTTYYANKGTEGILSAFTGCMNSIRETLGISKDQAVTDFKKEVADMYEFAEKLLHEVNVTPGKFINNQQNFGEFKKKMSRMAELYKTLVAQQSQQTLQVLAPIWNGLNKLWHELNTKYDLFLSSTQERPVPVLVWLWGGTDLGKSTLLGYLADELNRRMQRQMQTFTISCGPEYWNGYAQQDIIKIDDFGSWNGPEGSVDALAVFNLITPAPYNPNMAALQDKNTNATPQFVFVASNYPTVPLNTGVANIEAFERRRHVFCHVSWEGHEGVCHPGDKTCEHWQQVFERNKDTISDFSHLTFKICDPLVTKVSGQTMASTSKDNTRAKVVYTATEIDSKKISENGHKLNNIDVLIDIILTHHQNHAKIYEATLRRKNMSMLASKQSKVDYWRNHPCVAFVGEPGTGKTYFAESAFEAKYGKDWKTKVKCIASMEDLKLLKSSDWKVPQNYEAVFFEDLTNLTKNMDLFKCLCDAIAEKYDRREETQIWYMCVNDTIIYPKMEDIHGASGAEYYMRRVQKIKFNFRSYRNFKKFQFMTRVYSAEDVKAEHDIMGRDFDIDKYVDRIVEGKSYSFDQARTYIRNYEPVIEDEERHDELLKYKEFNPNTKVRINMPIGEFKNLCNSESPLAVGMKLVNGKTQVQSDVITVKDLGRMLLTCIQRAGSVVSYVDDIDTLFVEAWNRGYFETFRDYNICVAFSDEVYIIEGVNVPNVKVGKLVNPGAAMEEIDSILKESMKQISMSDILSVGTDILPNWLTLTGDIIATIAKVSLTAVISASAVLSERKKNKALEVYNKTETIVQEYTDQQLEAVPTSLGSALFPSKVTSVKEPRHSSLDVDNPYKERDTDPTKIQPKSARGWKQRDTDPTKIQPKALRGNVRQRQKAKDEDMRMEDPIHAPNGRESTSIPPKEEITLQVDATKIDNHAIKEASTDPQVPLIIAAVAKNCVSLFDSANCFLCYGVMVKGRLGTTVSHIKEGNVKDKVMVKIYTGQVYKAKFTTQDTTIDRIDFKIEDNTCQEFPDITHHFNSVEGAISYKAEGTLMTLCHDMKVGFPVLKLRSYRIEGMKVVKFQEDPTAFYHIQYIGHKVGVAMTSVQTYNGDCGSLLIINDPNWKYGKIVGMHVGAGSNVGYARLLHKEQYLHTQVQHTPVKQTYKPPAYLDPKYTFEVQDRDDGCIGMTKTTMYIPEKTKLYRNLEPVGKREYEPAVLGHKDPRKPGANVLRDEAMRWCKERTELSAKDRARFVEVRDQMADYYISVLAREGVELTTLTRMEAINKLRGCSKSEPINIKTSPGFPYSSITRQHGKRDFLYVDENGIHRLAKDHPNFIELKRGMDAYHNELHGRGVAPCIFKICLKDEPLKLGKQTRTIAAAPLDFQIVYRQYMHAAQAFVAENWHELPGKIGINPLSKDWNTLFHKLASNSLTGLDVDFSGWDFSPHPFLVSLLSGFWNRIYKALDKNWCEEHDRMRDILYSKVLNFQMLIGCSIYEATGGIPSGYPGTSPDNTVINDIVNCAVYVKLMEEKNPGCATVWAWFQDVVSATYGDDRLMTISPWLYKQLDLKYYKKQLEEWGFTATGADKSSDLKYKPLTECVFLSRGFKELHGFMVGPLNKSRMYKTTWWVHGNPAYYYNPDAERYADRAENIFNAYLCVLQEAAIHGEDEYEKIMKACIRVSERMQMPERWPTYKEMMARLFGIIISHNPSHGVSFHEEDEILDELDLMPLRIPQHAKIMPNRTAYSYGPAYAYKGVEHEARPIPEKLQRLLDYVNQKYDREWNSVLINRYMRGGSIPFHKDNEDVVDASQGVGCITLCGDGVLRFKDNHGTETQHMVGRGSFYIMEEENLKRYQHARTDHYAERTISITFRKLGVLNLECRPHQYDVPTPNLTLLYVCDE
ncbi:hypothetical protein 1 [Hubei picorna-like virus 71]|uniref:hypothetical protein 1 n=1 Tax=Hubei picorna-like virus 71 TaxID=1923155 RepID=UPI00090A868F|nr:hypothetical protein 1 [Hubei picorna-like virus 71]APG77431.1 hypothetical protein 1 [Hubei picorna-like virus 71]